MIERWTMAPWMRRRLARHVERGSSDRVIACLVGSTSGAAGEGQRLAEATPDLSNVILFRALAAAGDGVRTRLPQKAEA